MQLNRSLNKQKKRVFSLNTLSERKSQGNYMIYEVQ